MLIIDSHLDLAWSAVRWNRDLTRSVAETRAAERNMAGPARGTNTVTFPELRKAEVAVCVATVLARAGGAGDEKLDHRTQEIAYAAAQGQLAYYRVMESQGRVHMLRDLGALEDHLARWENGGRESGPLGFILSMEGADPIVAPGQLAQWWEDGLRAIGLAHFGVGAYAHGTGTSGGLTSRGFDLLRAMEELGVILDVTHLADESFWQAVEKFHGPVLASHNNCRSLVPGDRQFGDEQLRYLIQRGAVIGAVCDAWMLFPGWVRGETSNVSVTIETIVNHIDHVCQLAGNARHSAIGSDLDGGFGTEQCPSDLDTIADLQKITEILRQRGYAQADVESIMHGNWLRFFREAWAPREKTARHQ
ncbi:MAG: dipeptidase [Terriglobia bacterium]